jgi:hypothetical protein
VQINALSWNLYHGRDFPPDRSLLTWRSRLLRITERNETHVQVNRDLYAEFADVLVRTPWDVALLQEFPPRWAERLARDCGADHHRALTSRNSFGAVRAAIARVNPDLIASGEGGSNLTLVRLGTEPGAGAGFGPITDRRELTIRERHPERRTMAFTRTQSGLCIANLHTTNARPELATEEVLRAAGAATDWAGDDPLIFGGDLNLRPADHPHVFDALLDRFGLAPPTSPRAIDHLMVRGLRVVDRPAQWPAEEREMSENGRALRLSDHAPVAATFEYDFDRSAVG